MEFELHIDNWEGNVDKGTSLKIEKSDVKKYLRLLDGRKQTQILIIPHDKRSSLLIGGGNNNTYVATYTVGNDEDFYNLTDPNKPGNKEVELVTGGQPGLFLDTYCLDFDTILSAAIYYLETGERNPTLNWERQP